jgi:hypothetical protein
MLSSGKSSIDSALGIASRRNGCAVMWGTQRMNDAIDLPLRLSTEHDDASASTRFHQRGAQRVDRVIAHRSYSLRHSTCLMLLR